MADKTYKCPTCEQTVLASEAIPYKRRYYHKTCFDNTMKALMDKKSQKLKNNNKNKQKTKKQPTIDVVDRVSGQEAKDKRAYFNKLEELTGSRITSKQSKLSEDYHKKYKWEWTDMTDGLAYYFEILGHEVKGDCVGILPYGCVEAAQRYRENIQHANEKNRNAPTVTRIKTVKISRPMPKTEQIDISQIGES